MELPVLEYLTSSQTNLSHLEFMHQMVELTPPYSLGLPPGLRTLNISFDEEHQLDCIVGLRSGLPKTIQAFSLSQDVVDDGSDMT